MVGEAEPVTPAGSALGGTDANGTSFAHLACAVERLRNVDMRMSSIFQEFTLIRPIFSALAWVFVFQASVQALPPGAALLPGNTKLHVSIPDIVKLEKAWKKTKMAELFDDPKLKSFFT